MQFFLFSLLLTVTANITPLTLANTDITNKIRVSKGHLPLI